jgi:internalin A
LIPHSLCGHTNYRIEKSSFILERYDLTPAELEELIDRAKNEKWSVLNLVDKNLETLPESIWQLTDLTTLNLSFNKLVFLPESLKQLTNLNELALPFNKLASLPAAIRWLHKLQKTDLNRMVAR